MTPTDRTLLQQALGALQRSLAPGLLVERPAHFAAIAALQSRLSAQPSGDSGELAQCVACGDPPDTPRPCTGERAGHVCLFATPPTEPAEDKALAEAVTTARDGLVRLAAPQATEQPADLAQRDEDVEALFREVGRQMVEMTTTVRGPDEWLNIPELWRRCMVERDELRAARYGDEVLALRERLEGAERLLLRAESFTNHKLRDDICAHLAASKGAAA